MKKSIKIIYLCILMAMTLVLSSIVPVFAADSVDQYTKLLLHFDGQEGGTSIIDSATQKTISVYGNAQIKTDNSIFGGSAGYFDGNGDCFQLDDSEDFNFGSNDFTIDSWIKRTAMNNDFNTICGQGDHNGSGVTVGVMLRIDPANRLLGDINQNGNWYSVSSSSSITDNNWHHVAFVRSGNSMMLFIDGSLAGTRDVTGIVANNSTNKFSVGRPGEGAFHYFNGYIDELRVSNGIARWTSNFTVPNTPYGLTIPSIPTELTATAGNMQINLSWTAVTEATSYSVKRATTAGGPYETVASSVYETSYNDTTVTNGTTYYYIVSAVNSAGESPDSIEASATPFVPIVAPNAPNNLTAAAGNAKVDLSWNASEGATTYTVKRSTTAGGPYTTIASDITTTTCTDTNVTNDTTYYYVVTATNTAGESGNSNEASATPKAAEQPSGNRAIIRITFTNNAVREYDLSNTELSSFLSWYDKASSNTGDKYCAININSMIKPFTSRKDYIQVDKIFSFEVNEYISQ